MKSALKFVVIAVIAGLPLFSNAATCAQVKASLLSQINSAISTFPGSCRPMAIFQCRILFNTKLPQLRGVVVTNQYDKLRLVVEGVNENIERIRGIVAEEYTGQMNALIREMNHYNRQCGQ